MLLLAFVAARAALVPLTYDEAAAYQRYVAAPVPAVFDFSVATNHFLNSVLTRTARALGGDSELALRLPNVAACAAWLACTVLVLRRTGRPLVAAAGFLLVTLNLYVLEFFALSRGYGLSLALLMAALVFHFRALDGPGAGETRGRDLARALSLLAGAVAANFALLNVYLAVVALTLALSLASVRRRRPAPSDAAGVEARSAPARWRLLALALGAAAFTGFVLAHDVNLTADFYEPVTIRATGLPKADLAGVRAYRIDTRGRLRPLPSLGPAWAMGSPANAIGLRVDVPRDLVDRLTGIDVTIGSRPFWHRLPADQYWVAHDAGRMRVFESTPALTLASSGVRPFRQVINWRGDRNFLRVLTIRLAVALFLLAGFATLLWASGRAAARLGWLTRDEWRPVAFSALGVAALAGAPLYVMKTNGELFYGGQRGLVADTFGSLVDGTFYGRTYHAAQQETVLVLAGAVFALFLLAFCVSGRFRRAQAARHAAWLMAVMGLVAAGVRAQHSLFGTPYLFGRTALFLLPLFLLFVAFACAALADLGRIGRAAAAAALVPAVLAVSLHVARAANVTRSFEWPRDAATRAMAADVRTLVARERPGAARVTLGVDWFYYPVAKFYATRPPVPAIDVEVVPSRRTLDLMYLELRDDLPPERIVRSYPGARSALVRP